MYDDDKKKKDSSSFIHWNDEKKDQDIIDDAMRMIDRQLKEDK